MVVKACCRDTLPTLLVPHCRQGNQQNTLIQSLVTQASNQFIAVHTRHLQIKEENIGAEFGHQDELAPS